MLRDPVTGFGLLRDCQEKSVDLATRRLPGQILRRLTHCAKQGKQVPKEGSSLMPVVGGDRVRGDDLPVLVEPQVGEQNARRFVGFQSGDVLGHEVLQYGAVHEASGELSFVVLRNLGRNVVDGAALTLPRLRGLLEAIAPVAQPGRGDAVLDRVPSPVSEQADAVLNIRGVGDIGYPPAEQEPFDKAAVQDLAASWQRAIRGGRRLGQ